MERMLVGIAVALLLGAGARDAAAQAGAQAAEPPAAAAPPTAAVQAEGLPLAVRAGSPEGSARITVFCDVSDEACSRLVVVFAGLLDEFPDQMGLTFRHHAPEDLEAAHRAYRAVLAAARQGRGWQMLGLVSANGERLEDAGLRSMAAQLDLDLTRFGADRESPEAYGVAERDSQEAATLKLDAAPAVFLNGARLSGPYTFDSLASPIRKTRRP